MNDRVPESTNRKMTLAKSLQGALAQWQSPIRRLERDYRPRYTRAAKRRTDSLLVEQPPPPPPDPKELHRRVERVWRLSGNLDRLGRRDLKHLPWVLFFPSAAERTGRREWLGARFDFVVAFGKWLSLQKSGRPFKVLIQVFLRTYPVDLDTFGAIRTLLLRALEEPGRPTLERWRRRNTRYRLLQEDGPAHFFRRLLAPPEREEVNEILKDAGLDAGLSRSGFLRSAARRYMESAQTAPGEYPNALALRRLLEFLDNGGGLRFTDPDMRGLVADSLLERWVEEEPDPEVKQRLHDYFLRTYGDPRLRSGAAEWQGASAEARGVFVRWLVGETLDEFFALIREKALDHHWRYREQFWRAYHEKGLIRNAWVAMRGHASRSGPVRTGRLDGADQRQSVLLLDIGSPRGAAVTVAEWSHNGSCRIWRNTTRNKPILGQSRYDAYSLRRRADHVQPHTGSREGRWQGRIADWLRQHVGVRVGPSDYLLPER